MRHPSAEAWEQKLNRICRDIGDYLERKYGDRYPLHPARPPDGTTAVPEDDGLFSVTAAFTASPGSEHGPGYLVDIRFATLEPVAADVRAQVEADVVRLLREELPKAFPGRQLEVKREGPAYKIVGDLSLGSV